MNKIFKQDFAFQKKKKKKKKNRNKKNQKENYLRIIFN